MITLKNNKLPRLHLLLNKYKIVSKNTEVITYRKIITSKDNYNFAMQYYIDIFYHLKDNKTEVIVTEKHFNHEWKDWGYDMFCGEYENFSIYYIKLFDHKLMKYLEKMEV